jgi:hypothetical protein
LTTGGRCLLLVVGTIRISRTQTRVRYRSATAVRSSVWGIRRLEDGIMSKVTVVSRRRKSTRDKLTRIRGMSWSGRRKGGGRSRKRRRGRLRSIALRNVMVSGATMETAAISGTRSPQGRKGWTTSSLNVNVVWVALNQSLTGDGGTCFSRKRRRGTGTMFAVIQCFNLFLAVG